MKRSLYKELNLWKKSKDRKPLILSGARQTGKTWLLKEFGKNEYRKVHYINFEKERKYHAVFQESLSPLSIIEQISIIIDRDIDIKNDILIFDELQNCSGAVTSLKYFAEDLPELNVCSAGSLIGLTMNEASFPVGKVEFLTLYPMNFEEFISEVNPRGAKYLSEFNDKTVIPQAIHELLWQNLKIYYITGGLPEVVGKYMELKDNLFLAFKGIRKVQDNILNGYYSDFAKHAGKENAAHINMVFNNIPVQLAKAVDTNVGRFRFKGVIPNRSKFSQLAGPIEWLEKAGLALKVSIIEKPEIPLKSFSIDNRFKLYLFDVGILGAMLDLPAESILNQDYGSYKGFYAENYVAQEFVAADFNGLFCWQGRQSEIEFLTVHNNNIIPIEVKSGFQAKSKSLMVYSEKFKPKLKLKITARNLDRTMVNIHNYPLYLSGKIK